MYCMTKTITQDQLIRFMYQETGREESALISDALQADFELMEQLEQLQETRHTLDAALVSPSTAVIDRIKRYSRSTAPSEHLM
jgi:hypothetical protein